MWLRSGAPGVSGQIGASGQSGATGVSSKMKSRIYTLTLTGPDSLLDLRVSLDRLELLDRSGLQAKLEQQGQASILSHIQYNTR